MNQGIYRSREIWIKGYMDQGIYESRDIWIKGYMNQGIYGSRDIWINLAERLKTKLGVFDLIGIDYRVGLERKQYFICIKYRELINRRI